LTWIEINTELIPGETGAGPRVVCTFSDVTAYRKVLDDLRATEGRLLMALRAARMGAWEWKLGDEQVIWSDTVEDVFGVPRGSFDGRMETYLGLIHPDDRARVSAAIEAAIADPT